LWVVDDLVIETLGPVDAVGLRQRGWSTYPKWLQMPKHLKSHMNSYAREVQAGTLSNVINQPLKHHKSAPTACFCM